MPALAPNIRTPRFSGRRGITLLELLVVMVILSIVTAASIPMLTTGVESRRVREAARLVASYIGAARSRAIETGSPAGVMVQRYAGQNYALTLVGVEVPPPYAGDATNSTAIIMTQTPLGAPSPYGVIVGLGSGAVTPSASPSYPSPDVSWISLVRPGDLIRFGYQGRAYVIYGPNNPFAVLKGTATFSSDPMNASQTPSATNPWYLVAADGSSAIPPAISTATAAITVPYQIYRQPIKSAVQPLQLPEGTVIDLIESGVGVANAFLPAAASPAYLSPMLTFGPTGAVNLVYYDNNPPQHLQSTLFLLIGRRDGMEDLGFSTDQNILHHSSMWVAVGPQSALVVTAENRTGALPTARQYAQAASSIGGR